MAAEAEAHTDRQRTVHEAGHAVVAARLGVQVERVSIVPIPGARSHVKLPAHPGISATDELVVLMAGEEAQRRLEDAGPIAPGDRERAQLVLDHEGVDEARGRQMLAEGQERARLLLAEDHIWSQVEAVTAALLAEGTLDGPRFREVLASARA